MHSLNPIRWLLAFAFCFLRLSFGGDSSSSTSSTTNNTSNTTTTDRRSVADGQGVIVGDGASASVTNNVTDLGAIQRGADLAQAAIVGMTKLATDNQTAASKAVTASLGTAESALGKLEGAYQKANEQAQAVASGNKTLAIVGMIVAGLLGVELLKRKRAA